MTSSRRIENAVGPSVRRAARWLVRSGIQYRGRDRKLRGGIAAWYELDKKIYPFLYSEITGYALSAYVFLERRLGDPTYLRSARLAANWLSQSAMERAGGVKTRLYLVPHYVSPNYCFHHGRVYAFDTAMVGYGLVQLYRRTRDSGDFKTLETLAAFLLDRMRRSDGLFWPYYESKSRRCGEDLDKWSDQAGTFHAKLALFFIDYYKLTRKTEFLEASTRLLDSVLTAQEPDGRFVTGRRDGSTHLHPHAYTLEGLLYGGVHLQKDSYLKAARRGFKWMLKGVSPDGSVSSTCVEGCFSHHERTDIVAQTLRIGAVLYAIDPKQMGAALPVLKTIAEQMMLFQHAERGRQDGGFIYGSATDGLTRPHLNAWSTMFALQALWMYREFIFKKKKPNLDHFV